MFRAFELLMMGGKTPETWWVVNKRQDKIWKLLYWLVIYLNSLSGSCSFSVLNTYTGTKFEGRENKQHFGITYCQHLQRVRNFMRSQMKCIHLELTKIYFSCNFTHSLMARQDWTAHVAHRYITAIQLCWTKPNTQQSNWAQSTQIPSVNCTQILLLEHSES